MARKPARTAQRHRARRHPLPRPADRSGGPAPPAPARPRANIADPLGVGIGGEHSLDQIEQAHLTKVLDWAPSLHDAAEILGIDKATLYRKRKRLGMD